MKQASQGLSRLFSDLQSLVFHQGQDNRRHLIRTEIVVVRSQLLPVTSNLFDPFIIAEEIGHVVENQDLHEI